LVLSGGGARGFAHVGVIKVLCEAGVNIDYLAGTSAGGAVAAVYASGLSCAELEEMALDMSRWRTVVSLLDRSRPRLGLFSGDRVEDYFGEILGDKTFRDLTIPLAVVAVDLETGQEVVIKSGRVLDAVRATTAFPGVFAPKRIEGQLLVDGGLLNNLPVDVAQEMGADVVIAVDVSTPMDDLDELLESAEQRRLRPRLRLTLGTMSRSVAIMKNYIRQQKLEAYPPDLLLVPPICEEVGVFRGFTHGPECIRAGEAVARQALPAIQRLREQWIWLR
jgi:NTE family protein